MSLPNTTQTPNDLFDEEMKKMKDTELRIVLIVIRATLGWELNHDTGMRKTEDWIAHSQLIEKSGRKRSAMSYAIESCIKQNWIEARSKAGDILNTPKSRSGHKIYYRLGSIFTLQTSANSAQVKNPKKPVQTLVVTSPKIAQEPVQRLHPTKETIQNKLLQNEDAFERMKKAQEAHRRFKRGL